MKVAMNPAEGARFASLAEREAMDLERIGRRASMRHLPAMPAPDRTRVAALQRVASGGIEAAAWETANEGLYVGQRAMRFWQADEGGMFGTSRGWIGAVRRATAQWWAHPLYATKAGLLRRWRMTTGSLPRRALQYTRGFEDYMRKAGAGKKGSMANAQKWMKRGTPFDKVMRNGAAKTVGKKIVGKIPFLGDGVTAASIYAEERGRGSSTGTAAASAAGGTVGARGGAAAGALAGAAAGAMIGGPVGAVAGGALGAIAGSEAGQRIGSSVAKHASKLKFW